MNRRHFLAGTGAILASISGQPAVQLGHEPPPGETPWKEPVMPETRSVKPHEAAVSILVNQVGYNVVGTKVMMLQVRDRQSQPREGVFELIDESRRTVFRGALMARGGVHQGEKDDWNARYWTGDFSKFISPGTYRARLLVGSEEVTSFPFRIGQHLIFVETTGLAVRFYYWQRCGFAVPGLHAACHLDDARIPRERGGGHRDARGGWHDAGDFNKYSSFACRSVFAMITLARIRRPS